MEKIEKTVSTLCRQCDMHCGITVQFRDGRPEKVAGLKTNPFSRGFICAKGKAVLDWVTHPQRILTPLKRQADGSFKEIAYTDALNEIADRMLAIKRRYGAEAMGIWIGEALGFLHQPQYARRFIQAFGSPNYFSADSVCFSAVFIAYHLVKGYWGSFPDFENARAMLLWGINPMVSYPPYMRAIERAKKRGAKLIVIDPIKSETAKQADLFIQIRPGTDGALAWGLANCLIEHDWYDHEFVHGYATGFNAFSAYARKFSPKVVADTCGVSEKTLSQVAGLMAEAKPAVSQLTGISLEHHVNGVNTIRAIASLSGLCGSEDVKGGELWPKEIKTNNLCIHDQKASFGQRPTGADRYPLLYGLCGQCHSLTAMDSMLGEGEYPLRGLIMSGANPVLTNPNSKKVEKALGSLDLLVSRELFHTRTSRLAHYILPNASFLERSELYCYAGQQRVAISNKVFDIPGVTDDYTFWRDMAGILDLGDACFPWKDQDAVNRFILEPSGIDLDELKNMPKGWVYDSFEYKKYRRQSFPTPSGKYEFACRGLLGKVVPELPEYHDPPYLVRSGSDYPFILITGGRKKNFFNSRYLNVPRLREKITGPHVEISPADADRLEVGNGDWVNVASRIGSIKIQVRILEEGKILPGFVQITHGWDAANVNLLVDDQELDPISGFPNMKTIPVKIENL